MRKKTPFINIIYLQNSYHILLCLRFTGWGRSLEPRWEDWSMITPLRSTPPLKKHAHSSWPANTSTTVTPPKRPPSRLFRRRWRKSTQHRTSPLWSPPKPGGPVFEVHLNSGNVRFVEIATCIFLQGVFNVFLFFLCLLFTHFINGPLFFFIGGVHHFTDHNRPSIIIGN